MHADQGHPGEVEPLPGEEIREEVGDPIRTIEEHLEHAQQLPGRAAACDVDEEWRPTELADGLEPGAPRDRDIKG